MTARLTPDQPNNELLAEGLQRARRLSASIVHAAADREDVVQEALRRLLHSPPADDRNIAAYLCAAVRSVAYDLSRHDLRLRRRIEEFSRQGNLDGPEADLTPLTSLALEESRQAVRDAIERLPASTADVVRGLFLEEKSAKEVATELGVTVDTIYRHKKSALDKLRAPLKAHFTSVLAVALGGVGALDAGAALGIGSTFSASGAPLLNPAARPLLQQISPRLLGGVGALLLSACAIILLIKPPNSAPTRVDDAREREVGDARLNSNGETETSQSSTVERDVVQPASGGASAAGRPAYRLSIQVEDPSGAPVPGARVSVHPDGYQPAAPVILADDDGQVGLAQLPTRAFYVSAQANGTARTLRMVRDLPTNRLLSIRVYPVRPVIGQVVDAATNEPVEGVRVGMHYNLNSELICTECETNNGAFRASVAMDAPLIFFRDGYETYAPSVSPNQTDLGTIRLAKSESSMVTVRLSDRGELGPIRLRVVELGDGIPLSCAWRMVEHNESIPLPPGRYSFAGYVTDGAYETRELFSIYDSTPLTLTLKRVDTRPLGTADERESLITVTGKVLVNGQPVAQARIGEFGVTGPDGRFLIRVRRESWNLTVHALGTQWDQSFDFSTIVEDAVALPTWRHTLAPTGPSLVSGTLVNERGTRIQGTVTFIGRDGQTFETTAGALDEFLFSTLEHSHFPGLIVARAPEQVRGGPPLASEVMAIPRAGAEVQLDALPTVPVIIEAPEVPTRYSIERAAPGDRWIPWISDQIERSAPHSYHLFEGPHRIVFPDPARAAIPFDVTARKVISIHPR